MAQQPPVLQGWLTTPTQKITVQAAYASRYSLWVEGNGQPLGTEVENLELAMEDKLIQVGPCRVIPAAREAGQARRLVAVNKLHDFEKLFFHAKVETLESAALNLSLILGYKDSIDPAFRNYVSDLTYDLNVYLNLLDQMDAECLNEPPEVLDIVQGSIIRNVGKDLYEYMRRQTAQLERVVNGFSEKEHEHHGFYFRRQLWNILLRAPIMARTNLKPRGYNGDSEMMRMVYMHDYQGGSTFGKILHRFSVDRPAARRFATGGSSWPTSFIASRRRRASGLRKNCGSSPWPAARPSRSGTSCAPRRTAHGCISPFSTRTSTPSWRRRVS